MFKKLIDNGAEKKSEARINTQEITQSIEVFKKSLQVIFISNRRINEITQQLNHLLSSLQSALKSKPEIEPVIASKLTFSENTPLLIRDKREEEEKRAKQEAEERNQYYQDLEKLIPECEELLKKTTLISDEITKEENKKITKTYAHEKELMKKGVGGITIEMLPTDVLNEIFSYLATQKLGELRRVNKKFLKTIDLIMSKECMITFNLNVKHPFTHVSTRHTMAAKIKKAEESIDDSSTSQNAQNTHLKVLNQNIKAVSESLTENRKKPSNTLIFWAIICLMSLAALIYIFTTIGLIDKYNNDPNSDDHKDDGPYWGASGGVSGLFLLASCIVGRGLIKSYRGELEQTDGGPLGVETIPPGDERLVKKLENTGQKLSHGLLQFSFFHNEQIEIPQTLLSEEKSDQVRIDFYN